MSTTCSFRQGCCCLDTQNKNQLQIRDRISGLEVTNLFSCSTQLSMKFQLPIKTKVLKNKTSCFQTLRRCIYHDLYHPYYFSMKYIVMRKVSTDVGGIKQFYHVCPYVRKIIHSLKLVDYLHVQADKPWYNYYIMLKCQQLLTF